MKIKNLSKQLQIVGANDEFPDTIKFYNKQDNDSNIRLGVSAEKGSMVLTTVDLLGNPTSVLETFSYARITEPTSTNIEDLVGKVNIFIRDITGVPVGSSDFLDTEFRIQDDGDITKQISFQAEDISSGTTRTITVPDNDVDLGDIATNSDKVTNATHTGDVTGATALTLATVNSDVGSYAKPTLTVNAKGLVTAVKSEIMGGLVVTSTSTTNVANGSYNVLEDTTALTSVNSGIAQDSDWTLEITEAGITNQKGRVSAVVKCEKTGGAGRQYDFAIFKNGSIVSDSEMADLTLENNDTWGNIKCTAPVELSTGDLFSIRVSGNGTGDDIECTNGTIYID